MQNLNKFEISTYFFFSIKIFKVTITCGSRSNFIVYLVKFKFALICFFGNFSRKITIFTFLMFNSLQNTIEHDSGSGDRL